MKIAKIHIENFRGYKKRTSLDLGNLTLLVGKNDVGKSTFLEAADIFFGNRKLDKDDLNIECGLEEKVSIEIEFRDFPVSVDIDSGAETDFMKEYLLNPNGNLHIVRKYTAGSTAKPKQYLRVEHPSAGSKGHIINEKITELRRIGSGLGLVQGDDFNGSISNSIRKAIWQKIIEDGALSAEEEIEINKEDGKKIAEKIEELFPIYTLFSADRKNTDQDDEVQKPIKTQIKVILKELEDTLEEVRLKVKKRVDEITEGTQSMLKDMNAEIAEQLTSKLDTPAWDKAFTVNIETDGVPLNKRGSGVKRLVLINFFREEAERRRKTKTDIDVFYAIEEPETSQHPNWQNLLFSAFLELSQKSDTQIAFTTHHPELAGLVEVKNIRYIEEINSKPTVHNDLDEKKLYEVADTLGVLPKLKEVKVVFCLEGPTDVTFFKGMSKLFGVDADDDRILWLPVGGANLKHFVAKGYLEVINKPQVHFYDRDDDNKYESQVKKLKEQGHEASLSAFQSMESYIHPRHYYDAIAGMEDFIDTGTKVWLDGWSERSVPSAIVEELKKRSAYDSTIKPLNSKNVKLKLCELGEAVSRDDLSEMGALEEIEDIFSKLKVCL